MKTENENLCNFVKFSFPAKSINEGFARMAVSAFMAQADPTVGELSDVKTAVSEAVTNCIVHAYCGEENKTRCLIYITATLENNVLTVRIKDKGKGIEDIKKARTPMWTTDSDGERSGMGFTIMESFSDSISVRSKPQKGTTVILTKRLGLR